MAEPTKANNQITDSVKPASAAAEGSRTAIPEGAAPSLEARSAAKVSAAAHNVTNKPWRSWHTYALLVIVGAIVALGVRMTPASVFTSWLATMALMVCFIAVAGNGITGRWMSTLIDERNMVSLSRMQLLVWTILILSAFLTAGLGNIVNGSDNPLDISLPQQLWLLMGISTTTLAATPLIQNQKKDQPLTQSEARLADLTLAEVEAQKGSTVRSCDVINDGRLIAHTSASCASWGDMFRGDEVSNGAVLDLSKVQLFFFTIILVLAYASALGAMFSSQSGVITTFPDLDSSVIALLGISHAGYLTTQVTQSTQR